MEVKELGSCTHRINFFFPLKAVLLIQTGLKISLFLCVFGCVGSVHRGQQMASCSLRAGIAGVCKLPNSGAKSSQQVLLAAKPFLQSREWHCLLTGSVCK